VAYKSKIDQAAAGKRHYEANKGKIKARSADRNKKQRARNRAYVKEEKEKSCCIDCGETNSILLDYDHVRGKKKMNISDMARSAYSIASIQREIDKCEVRCSNCHRLVTHKRRIKLNEQTDSEGTQGV